MFEARRETANSQRAGTVTTIRETFEIGEARKLKRGKAKE
jgi:hypothetical protein